MCGVQRVGLGGCIIESPLKVVCFQSGQSMVGLPGLWV